MGAGDMRNRIRSWYTEQNKIRSAKYWFLRIL